MDETTKILFDLIDKRIQTSTKAVCGRVYAERADVKWTLEQREKLATLVRAELRSTVQGILGIFDNIGSVLPDEAIGWKICRAGDGGDIRIGDADYADMWLDYLREKDNVEK